MFNTDAAEFAALAAFSPIPMAQAEREFDFGRWTEVFSFTDLFGETPESVFVAKGDVHHTGSVSVAVNGDYAGVFVIDGNLTVDETFAYRQVGGGSVLIVTGEVFAKTLAVTDESQLWVGKDIVVPNVLVDDTSDGGAIVAWGTVKARVILATGRRGLTFENIDATTRVIERSPQGDGRRETTADALVDAYARASVHDLVAALAAGEPILRSAVGRGPQR